MNAKQRQRLREALVYLEEAKEIITEVQSQEDEKFNNLSENLQSTAANKIIESKAETLSELEDDLQVAIEQLQDVINE